MTDRDRLIELIRRAKIEEVCCTSDGEPVTKWQRNIVDRAEAKYLADYLLANGVIVPPCNVGQTVYCVDDYLEVVEECKVYGFNVVNGKLSLLVNNGEDKFITRKWHNTKEQAEEKLKELRK